MKIDFKCQTNKDYVAINALKFKFEYGTTLTIDRKSTEYNITPSGLLTMTWNDCYLWAINGCNIFGETGHHFYGANEIKDFSKLVADAGVKFEIEDDADSDYEVVIKSYTIS